ncbi:anti-repressor SinI family protein [Paenibacillus sp. Soil522]|uniref:anti-repressor SinI family protein n=1 Tax=Paenibacillus sp. Soil522 TaxID=1736388 RepID=UPI0009D7547F|nr:anti-repressor SinI family protein [Paenibacillus sp. Soil522]
MVLAKSENNQDLDMEWVALIMDARTLGLSKEDIRKALLLLKENGKDDMQETAV